MSVKSRRMARTACFESSSGPFLVADIGIDEMGVLSEDSASIDALLLRSAFFGVDGGSNRRTN